MELGDLLSRLYDARKGPFKSFVRGAYLEHALLNSQCEWKELKKTPGLKSIYPGLFCSYEDLPLYVNGTDWEDEIVVKWRLELGK